MDLVLRPTTQFPFVTEDGNIYGRVEWPEPDETTPVGLYEGAWFRTKRAYRPELRCRMRSGDDMPPGEAATPRFCKVCREALTIELVANAGTVRSVSPHEDAIIELSTAPELLHFEVQPHVPTSEDHLIEVVAWRLDGEVLEGQTGMTLALDKSTVNDGEAHLVEVVLADRSAFLLAHFAEGQARMTQTISWNLAP